MKNILIIGSTGQIGSELTQRLRDIYGESNVIAGYIPIDAKSEILSTGLSEIVDATNINQINNTVKKYQIDTIFNLAAILSAVAESKPIKAWEIGINGLLNCLEVARENKCAVFTPSSIGAFGGGTPLDKTPQDTIMRPQTIYGISKVTGELLSDYYYKRYNVDTRSLRYPGIISNVTLPGGGTTDYAVEIYYEAVKNKKFISPLKAGTFLDMMYMPDALNAAIELMEANPDKLIHRNSFNVTAMSFDPEIISNEIKKHIPEFEISYNIDSMKQTIADSWPNSLDDSCAKVEWDWRPKWNLQEMTIDMIKVIKDKHKKGLI